MSADLRWPDAFATVRLMAERLRPAHVDAIHCMHQDTAQMALVGGVRTTEQTDAYMRQNLEHWNRYGFGTWVLSELTSRHVAGRALLRHLTVDETDEVEVGYSFYPRYWGQGLATEITRACLSLAHESLGLSSVVAITRPSNKASQRVMTKAGMIFEREIEHDGQQHVLYRGILR